MRNRFSHKRRLQGLTLVELLVSLAIGSLLVVGAVTIYSQSRSTSVVSDTVARLQENARFSIAVLAPDVQLAGGFGYSNFPSDITYDGTPVVNMTPDDAEFAAAPAAAHACGPNFALNLMATVGGVDQNYGLTCAPFGAGAMPDTDVLIVRRTGPPVAVNANVIQLYSNRVTPWTQRLFMNAAAPGPIAPDMNDVRNLMVNVYYVSQDSDHRAGFPSLRRKWLGLNPGGAYVMNDEEIMSGVEDFQVQFGVDMGTDLDGDDVGDDTDDNDIADETNGRVTRYVDADAAGIANMTYGQVASVRLWIRLRADLGEAGFNNTQRYEYASTDFQAADNVRRLLVSRTFFLRNSRLYRQ